MHKLNVLLYHKLAFDIHLNENKKSGYLIKTLPVAVSSSRRSKPYLSKIITTINSIFDTLLLSLKV